MRELKVLAVALAVVVLASGCATFRDREWGTCAIAGGIIGGAIGGTAGGVAVNNTENHPSNGDRGGAIAGGVVGGALLGALLGHVICDPMKPAPKPVAAPAPPPPPPPPPPKGTKLGTVGETYFDFDKAEIKAHDGRGVLDEIVKTMRDNPSLRVVVEGHTDAIGSDAYNQRLSERRANAVKRYLVAQGIDASRIDTRGFGKSKPVADNGTAAGRAKNRRAEIIAE
ncbi:MAG TPA: OmpA family protein [Candidatus Binatia bacterium]|nr:OmpA family protein [Candidatus Binatia bacterium]